MSGIIGKKIGMTRIFETDGRAVPVTVVACNPNEIAQLKSKEKDGYSSVVLGFNKLKSPSKTRKFECLKEFTIKEEEKETFKAGEQVTVDSFKEIKSVTVTANSKGKGTQGVIKRHNFARGPETHGSHHHRKPGSVGACAFPGRVHKGKKLPGRMGNSRTTIHNKKVIKIESEKNLILIKGPVPGPINGFVFIYNYEN